MWLNSFFFCSLSPALLDPWAFISISLFRFGGQCSISLRRGMDGFIGNMGEGENFQHQNWVSWTRIFKEMLCSNTSVYLLGGHECSQSICWLWDYTHINSANTIKKNAQIFLWHLTVSNLTEIASRSSLRSEDRQVGIFEYGWRD